MPGSAPGVEERQAARRSARAGVGRVARAAAGPDPRARRRASSACGADPAARAIGDQQLGIDAAWRYGPACRRPGSVRVPRASRGRSWRSPEAGREATRAGGVPFRSHPSRASGDRPGRRRNSRRRAPSNISSARLFLVIGDGSTSAPSSSSSSRASCWLSVLSSDQQQPHAGRGCCARPDAPARTQPVTRRLPGSPTPQLGEEDRTVVPTPGWLSSQITAVHHLHQPLADHQTQSRCRRSLHGWSRRRPG